jgi:hypothetical protein
VKAYQKKNGLAVDGYAGCKTTTKMGLSCADHNCNQTAKPTETPTPPTEPTKPPAPIVPPSGASHQIIFHLNPPNGENKFQIIGLDYHQDLEDHTGGGQLTLPLDHDVYEKFKINNTFELKWTWTGSDFNSIMTGYITKISRKGNHIQIDFKDKGSLLEKKNYLKYTNMRRSAIISDIIRKAGLNPVLNWVGSSDDDITSYTDDASAQDKRPTTKKPKKKKGKKKGKKKDTSTTITKRPF